MTQSIYPLPPVDVRGNTVKDSSGDAWSLLVDADGHLQVDVLTGASGGTQYTEGDTDASITGTAILWEDTSNTLRPPAAQTPLPTGLQAYDAGAATYLAWRCATEGTLLASATRNANTASSNQANVNHRGVIIVINCTSSTGTVLSVNLQGKDPISGSYYRIHSATGATCSGVGLFAFAFYPGWSAAGSSAASTVYTSYAVTLPKTWRVTIGHGDGVNVTYSVSYCLIP